MTVTSFSPQSEQPQWPLGIFFVRSKLNGLVLDAKGEGMSPGTDVIMWSQKSPPAANQQWKFEPEGIIRNVKNGLVLDIKGGAGGSDVICWTYNGGANQKWMFDGVHIQSKMNGKLLDIKGASQKAGADVIVWQSNNGKNQEWELIPVGGTTPMPSAPAPAPQQMGYPQYPPQPYQPFGYPPQQPQPQPMPFPQPQYGYPQQPLYPQVPQAQPVAPSPVSPPYVPPQPVNPAYIPPQPQQPVMPQSMPYFPPQQPKPVPYIPPQQPSYSNQPKRVTLFNESHKKYVCAEANCTVVANRSAAGAWEVFQLIHIGGQQYAFKSHLGKYLCAEPYGTVICNRDAIGPWETFIAENHQGKVAFRSNHGKYLCAEANGTLVANRTAVGAWELFNVCNADGMKEKITFY